MRNYMILWSATKDEINGTSRPLLDHLCGNQLNGIKPNDIIWIVNNQSEFVLLGKIIVEIVVDSQDKAEKMLGHEVFVPNRNSFAISKSETIEQMKWIPIIDIAPEIRFETSGNNKLNIVDGKISSSQIRSRRKLSDTSSDLFSKKLNEVSIESKQMDQLFEEDIKEYHEGKASQSIIQRRIRNRELVRKAKEEFMQQNKGQLFCEVCKFNFNELYEIDFIEAHHTKPISEYDGHETSTTDSLMMLCANCHRALHHSDINNNLEKLKKLVIKNKKD